MEEYKILLSAEISDESITNINTEIKNMKISKIPIELDTKGINKQLDNIRTKIETLGNIRINLGAGLAQGISSGMSNIQRTIDTSLRTTEKSTQATISNITKSLREGFAREMDKLTNGRMTGLVDEKSIQQAAQIYFTELNKIGDVTTRVFRNNQSEIDSFVLDVKNAEGVVESLRYKLEAIKNDQGGEKIGVKYAFNSASSSDNNIRLTEEAARKAAKEMETYNTQMAKNEATAIKLTSTLTSLKSKYEDVNASKPIQDKSHLESLNAQYEQTQKAITALSVASKEEFDTLKANADSEIAKLKDLTTQYQNAEYAANQLAAKPISVIKDNEGYKLTEFEAKIKAAGVESSELSNKVAVLRAQLNKVGDKQALSEYLNSLSTVKAEFDSLVAQKKADEVATRQQEAAYKPLEVQAQKLTQQIKNLELQTQRLRNAGGSNNQVTELENQIAQLRSQYGQLMKTLAGNIPMNQMLKITNTFDDMERKLEVLRQKAQDTKQALYDSIKGEGGSLTTGGLGDSVQKLQYDFNNLGVESKEVSGNIQTLQSLLNKMDSSDDIESVIADYQQFQNILDTTTNTVRQLKREQSTANANLKLNDAKVALGNDIDVWLQQNSAAAKTFGARLQEIKAQIQSADATQLQHLRREFQDVTKQAQLAGVAGKTLGDQFKQSLKTVTSYFSAAMLITRAISVMRNMYNEVLKVDTAMTGLRRVTNLTGEQYQKMYDDMTESAKKYGATLTDIINSTASWVRLGFSTDTAQKLSEITALYQHVADLDYNTAVENLVTTYKGFESELKEVNNGDEAKSMLQIVDILDKLNNEMPVTAAQVGQGLTKAAAIMQQSGASLAETASMIVGGGSVTQDFDAFGNALRVSAMRIRSMKGELQELGEEVDENVISVSKMQTQILNLTHGKVNIFEDDGKTYKNITEVYREIAGVLDELSETEASELIELIAGKNRANQILGMLTHWSDVETALSKSLSANGTAMAENQKHMESMAGKIEATKAAWQALANTFLSSDFLKGLIDTGQDVLTILNNIIKVIGTLPTILLSAGIYKSIKSIS